MPHQDYMKALMKSRGVVLRDGQFTWEVEPWPGRPRERVPLPDKLRELLEEIRKKEYEAAKARAAAAAEAATGAKYQQPGTFAPSEEAVDDAQGPFDQSLGPSSDPATRLREALTPTVWPTVGRVAWRNLRVPRFDKVWSDVLGEFQVQYADYLENTITELDGLNGKSIISALVLVPRSVGSKLPAPSMAKIVFTEEEERHIRMSPVRYVEAQLSAAIATLEKARQSQIERENKAALAAAFALDVVQFLADDNRQRTEIASGVTIRPLVDAVMAAEDSRLEAHAADQQLQAFEAVAKAIDDQGDPFAKAAGDLALQSAFLPIHGYGPVNEQKPPLTRAQAIEVGAKALAALNVLQQRELLWGSVRSLTARRDACTMRSHADLRRAAVAAQSAHMALVRLADAAHEVTNKVVLACSSGGALNYAQHEQRCRTEFVSLLRAGLIELSLAARGLFTIFGFDRPLPAGLAALLPAGAFPAALGGMEAKVEATPDRPEDVLLQSLIWAREAAKYVVTGARNERKWSRTVSLRQTASDDQWNGRAARGVVSLTVTADELGGQGVTRLAALAVEIALKGDAVNSPAYRRAILELPDEAFYRVDEPVQQADLSPLDFGRIEPRMNGLRAVPPEIIDRVANASAEGEWSVSMDDWGEVSDVLIHMWLAERNRG
jgi:hypothetical protein